MPRDYHVQYRREGDIALTAATLRNIGHIEHFATFNIVNFVKDLQQNPLRGRGFFELRFFDQREGEARAFVKYRPFEMWVDHELWQLAELGDPESRFIIAHEIGHLVLHDDDAKEFSNTQLAYDQREQSAEWQANTFASYLLLSDEIAAAFSTDIGAALSCGVPLEIVRERRAQLANRARFSDRTKWKSEFEAELCPECGNFTMVRNGTCLKCDTCGGTTGCL